MQCPLCRESVADDNALQVHYLMSCRGYLENPSAKNPDEGISYTVLAFLIQNMQFTSNSTYLCSFIALQNVLNVDFLVVVGPPSKKLVQLRWVKTKPTLAREVYLISSLVSIFHICALYNLANIFTTHAVK